MVRQNMTRAVAIALATALLVAILAPVAMAQDYRFAVPDMQAHLYVNPDGTVRLAYDLTFAPDPGSHPIDVVDIGLPNDSYSDVSASINGVPLDNITTSPYVENGLAVDLGSQAIQPGTQGTLHFEATLSDMIYQDSKDPEYASLVFAPTWFDSQFVHGLTRLEVNYHFPPGVVPEEPRYHDQEFTEARFEDGRVIYTWVREDADASNKYEFGASFPKRYLAEGVVQTAPAFNLNIDFSACCSSPAIWFVAFGGGWALLSVLGARSQKRRKMQYMPPSLAVEGTGIKRGLTAVEAAVLLEAPLNKVVTMILFGLVKKGVVAVESQKPLKLRVLKEETPDAKLWYYERRFVKAIQDNGSLDEAAMREMTIDLISDVNKKMTGFSRRETKAYYKDIAARAWQQVEASDTPELLGQRWSEGLEWTMLEDNWDDHTRRAFHDRPVVLPHWWWYYRPWTAGSGPAHAPVSGGSPISVGGGPVTLPTLPGADFANTVVSGIEGAANTVVSSVESFTDKITQTTNPPPKPSSSSSRGGGYSCACACACAGCACACAGGGR